MARDVFTKEQWDELKKERLKHYQILPIDLTEAHNEEKYVVAGTFFYVLDYLTEGETLESLPSVRFNEIVNDSINLYLNRKIRTPFYQFFITNEETPGVTLLIAVSSTVEDFDIGDYLRGDWTSLLKILNGIYLSLAYFSEKFSLHLCYNYDLEPWLSGSTDSWEEGILFFELASSDDQVILEPMGSPGYYRIVQNVILDMKATADGQVEIYVADEGGTLVATKMKFEMLANTVRTVDFNLQKYWRQDEGGLYNVLRIKTTENVTARLTIKVINYEIGSWEP